MDEVDAAQAGTSELPRLQWAAAQEVPLWDISNCVLQEGQILISPEDEVETDRCHTSCTNTQL